LIYGSNRCKNYREHVWLQGLANFACVKALLLVALCLDASQLRGEEFKGATITNPARRWVVRTIERVFLGAFICPHYQTSPEVQRLIIVVYGLDAREEGPPSHAAESGLGNHHFFVQPGDLKRGRLSPLGANGEKLDRRLFGVWGYSPPSKRT